MRNEKLMVIYGRAFGKLKIINAECKLMVITCRDARSCVSLIPKKMKIRNHDL